MNRLILPVMIMTLLVAAVSSVVAQEIPLPFDTMKVVDSYGRPGDTVNVGLYFANTSINIQGYTARIVFSSTVLEAIDVACVDRGCELDATSGVVEGDTALKILAYTFRPGHYIGHGRGVVANMRFRVRPTAPQGSITTLRFVDNRPDAINAWADETGSGILYIPSLIAGNFSVTGGTGNQPPAVGYVGPQQVAEGQVLQFLVTAHDPNGDPITLSAQNLPANSSFPTVQGDSVATGTFIFTPSFEQGPDTFYVSFVANDDHNNTTTLTVQIVVLDQPNDILSVDSGQGGVPGAQSRDINIDLFNSRHVFGLQFNYFYDPAQIQITDIIPTERCLGLGFWYSFPDPGRIVILIFSPGLDPISIGSGTIVRFVTDVNTDAIFGRTAVELDSVIEVIDSIGTSRSLVTENGYFTVDRFGDANLDEDVNVGDCVTIVAFIIERLDLDVRKFDAADINRDGRVNVGDLQNVIDLILEIPVLPGSRSPFPQATVELKREATQIGDIVSVPLWADISTEAAAVQYELTYNSDRLEALGAEPGEMVSNLRFDNNINSGKMNGVFYDLGGNTFGPSTGEMATFRFRVKQGEFNPRDVNLNEFLIVDRASGFLSSEIIGQLPGSYALSQNYPNPFNSNTVIDFDLPTDGKVDLSVYDVLGRKVVTLLNDNFAAGSHSVTWDGHSDSGETLATGVFFYRLQAAGFDETRKMLLVK